MPKSTPSPFSPSQEMHKLALILRHVEDLSPQGRSWLLGWLEADVATVPNDGPDDGRA